MELALAKDISLLVNAVGVGNCYLLSYTYLKSRTDKSKQSELFLSALFFVLGTVILNTLLNFTGYSQLFYGFEPLSNALTFAIAPLLYLYVRSYNTMAKSQYLSAVHLLHFYCYLLVTIIAITVPKSILGALGKQLIHSELMLILWNIHFFVYVVLLTREFRKTYARNLNMQKWIALGVTSIWFINLCFYVYRLFIEPLSIFLYLNITLLFTAMSVWLFYRKFSQPTMETGRKTSKTKLPKKNSVSDTEYAIAEQMQKHKYYRNPDLDIRKLSEKLQIPYHELSLIINRQYQRNFNEFINEFRIREVTQALESKQHQAYTIMGLAQKAGFKSASSFYAAFKREKGSTPTAFLKKIGA